MKDLFDCINSKVKEKKKEYKILGKKWDKERKEREKIENECLDYFNMLEPSDSSFGYETEKYRIEIEKRFLRKNKVEIRTLGDDGKYIKTCDWGIQTIMELYNNRESILKEIAKQYGCI